MKMMLLEDLAIGRSGSGMLEHEGSNHPVVLQKHIPPQHSSMVSNIVPQRSCFLEHTDLACFLGYNTPGSWYSSKGTSCKLEDVVLGSSRISKVIS